MAVIRLDLQSISELSDGQELEVKHLMEMTGLSIKQARELLARYGNDWERIRKESENYKAES